MYSRLSVTPGSEQTLPREAPARRVVHRRPVLLPENPRAVVWEGRGSTARPREAKWRSGGAPVLGGYYNQNIFKDPFGHYYQVLPTRERYIASRGVTDLYVSFIRIKHRIRADDILFKTEY